MKLLSLWFLCVPLVGCPAIGVSGTTCAVDSECKGDRVCELGVCVPGDSTDANPSDADDANGADVSDAAQDVDSGTPDTLVDADVTLDVAETSDDGLADLQAQDSEGVDGTPDTLGDVVVDVTDTGGADSVADAAADITDVQTPDAVAETDTGPVSICPEFSDPFDGNALGSMWTKVFPERVGVADGALSLTVTAAANDEFVRAALSLPDGFNGGTVTMEIGSLEGPDANMRLWIQRVPSSLQHNTEISISAQSVGARYNDETGNTLLEKVDYDPLAHKWLRLHHDGAVMHYQTSADGQTFQTLATVALPFELNNVNVAIAASNALPMASDVTVTAASFELSCEP